MRFEEKNEKVTRVFEGSKKIGLIKKVPGGYKYQSGKLFPNLDDCKKSIKSSNPKRKRKSIPKK